MAQRKILIITNRIPWPLNDGGNLAMRAMIQGYSRGGWAVHLLAMNTSRHFIPHEQLQTLYTDLHAFEWVDVNNHIQWPGLLKNFLFSRQPEHASRFNDHGFREKLAAVLAAFKPDVVQVESVYLSVYLPLIKAAHPVTVLRLHNAEYQIWQRLAHRHTNPVKRFYFKNLARRIKNFERRSWKQYNLLLPITEKDAQIVTRLETVSRMVVAPFSIEAEKIKSYPGERWAGYHIGAMDWIANRDGVKWFLDKVWPAMHTEAPGFEFYFAGRAMPDEFKQMAIPGVHCAGAVADAEAFIADKKILIVPLWSGGGIRVKILEAMAACKVVITTPYGIKGIEAIPGTHFLLVRRPEDFVKAVRWCLDNKPAAEEMARKAQQLIRDNYESGKVIGAVITEIEDLLTCKDSKKG